MARPREFDEPHVLDQALRVFWRNGYEGTSLTELTDAMGISRPSLYAAFGSKEALFRRVIDRYIERYAGEIASAVDAPTARDVAQQYWASAIAITACRSNPRGCLLVQSLLACGQNADPLRQEVAARRIDAERALHARFERAREERDLPDSVDPAALARYVATINYGLAVQASSGASANQLKEVAAIALNAIPSSKA